MPLFFTRRSYNASKKKFTKNPAEITRYVTLDAKDPDGDDWKGGIISQADWLDAVSQAGGDKAVLIYVHGFNTDQSDMLNRLEKIGTGVRAQGFEGAVIAYDWPSDGSVFAYNKDRADAKKTAPFLVSDGVLPLLSISPRPKIHLLAHSMGGLVVLRGFSDFGDSAGPGSTAWKVDEVTFASADVDSVWLEKGAWGALVLKQRARRFTNYYSREDKVLDVSEKLIHGGRDRAGEVGLPELITTGHNDVRCDTQYLRDVAPGDQTQVYSHRWWFDNAGYYKDLAATLAGSDASELETRREITGTSDQELFT